MLTPELRTKAEALIDRYPLARSALLPLLHLVQHQDGYVTSDGIAECAELLGLTKAEVMAVSTFYTMFKREEMGTHLVSVCTNFSCKVRGAQEVYDALSERLGVGHNGTTDDGALTLEHAECLGNCEGAPVVSVDYLNYECLDVDAATELVDRLKAGEVPPPTRGFPPPGVRALSHRLAGLGPHDWTSGELRSSVVDTASTRRPGPVTTDAEHADAEGGDPDRPPDHAHPDPDRPPSTSDQREGKRHGPDADPSSGRGVGEGETDEVAGEPAAGTPGREAEKVEVSRAVAETGTGDADEVEEESAYSGREAPTSDPDDASSTATEPADPRSDASDATPPSDRRRLSKVPRGEERG